MQEIIMILMMTLGVLLFTLGGYKWKWMRRYLMPVLFGILIYFYGGMELWRIILSMGILIGVMTLPYGDSTPWILKFLVGCSYTLPALVFGFSVWVIVTPIFFITLFIMSNWSLTDKQFPWKVCEGLMGFIIPVTILVSMQNPWR